MAIIQFTMPLPMANRIREAAKSKGLRGSDFARRVFDAYFEQDRIKEAEVRALEARARADSATIGGAT